MSTVPPLPSQPPCGALPTFLSVEEVASRPGTAGQKDSAHVALSWALSRYSGLLPAPCKAASGRGERLYASCGTAACSWRRLCLP